MKMNYQKGEGHAGGIILIVFGALICILLLGVVFKTIKGTSIVPTNTAVQTKPSTTSTKPKPTTSSTTLAPKDPNQLTVGDSTGCRMIIDEPKNGGVGGHPLFFEGHVVDCGDIDTRDVLGTVGLYDYESNELVQDVITIKAGEDSVDEVVYFRGYIEHEPNTRVERGYLYFRHFKPNGTTKTQTVTVYY